MFASEIMLKCLIFSLAYTCRHGKQSLTVVRSHIWEILSTKLQNMIFFSWKLFIAKVPIHWFLLWLSENTCYHKFISAHTYIVMILSLSLARCMSVSEYMWRNHFVAVCESEWMNVRSGGGGEYIRVKQQKGF